MRGRKAVRGNPIYDNLTSFSSGPGDSKGHWHGPAGASETWHGAGGILHGVTAGLGSICACKWEEQRSPFAK